MGTTQTQSQDCNPDNLLDLSNDSFEEVLQDADVHSMGTWGMGHSYIKGRLVIIVHIWIRGVGLEVENGICATVYSALEEMRLRKEHGSLEAKLPCRQMLGRYIEQPMLVSVVEVTDQSEERRYVSVPSIVRLQSLDSCLGRCAEAADLSIPVLGPIVGLRDDWKLNTAVIRGRSLTAISNGEAVSRVIKRGPQIMNAITGDQRPSIKGRGFTNIENDAVVATLSVELLDGDIGVCVKPRLPFSGVDFQVFLGTANLEDAGGELRSDHAVYRTSGSLGVSS
jgi:hypothetical protein